MWETLPNNADWDCFKTPIFNNILNEPGGTSLFFSEVKQGKELLRHPVAEQLVVSGTRLEISEHQKSTNNPQWHDSRAVYEELPRRTQQHFVV